MKYIIQNLLVFFYLILTGCVAAQVTETAPLKSTIQEQYDKSVELYTQALRDYSDKSYLFKNLEGTIKDESLQARLKDHLGYMTNYKDNVTTLHENLEISKNQILRLLKNKTQITSKDPAWSSEQSLIQSFNTNMGLFNKTLENYSRESATFTKMISDNKLVVIAKVGDIKTRMGENVVKAQTSLKILDADIKAAKKLAASNGKPFDEVSSQTIDAERNLFASTLKDLERIYDKLKKDYGGKTKISTTDAGWNTFQKLVTDSEIKSKELHDISARLPLELENLKGK